MPDCVAWMVQVPRATSVTTAPETEQTDIVVEAKLTGRPDVAVAFTANGAVPKGWFERAPNPMVWLPWLTISVTFTVGPPVTVIEPA